VETARTAGDGHPLLPLAARCGQSAAGQQPEARGRSGRPVAAVRAVAFPQT
jgi:hypothetical protein